MFSDFLSRLTQPQPDPLAEDDARLALTALLVRIARSDNDYADTEMARIDRISAQRYGLSPFEAAGLRAKAEDLEAEAPDTVRFTRAIKEAVPYDDRLGVVEALWSVVLADGQRTGEEDSLLRLVVSLLGVSDVDSALARQKGCQIVTAMLGMYDMPALQPANDRFWDLIRGHLGDGHNQLSRDPGFLGRLA